MESRAVRDNAEEGLWIVSYGPLSSALVREWMAAPLRGAMEANSNGLRLIGSSRPRPLGGGYVAWPTQMGTALENRVM